MDADGRNIGLVDVYSGPVKVLVCDRLGSDWYRLANFFGIPPYGRAAFTPGREPSGVWEWLELRSRLAELPEALKGIGRDDLAGHLADDTSRTLPVLTATADPAAHLRVFDTAFFDLADVRRKIEDALQGSPRPVAFVLHQPEETYVGNLTRWLEHCVEGIRKRAALSLNPLGGGVEHAVAYIEKLRSVITTADVLFPVNVHSSQVDSAEVARFWAQVHDRFAGVDRWLILMIQVHNAEVAGDGLVPLPAPEFTKEHVRAWGRHLLASLGWSPLLVNHLTRAVSEYADTRNGLDVRHVNDALDVRHVYDALDVRHVYDALDGVIDDLRTQRELVREQLQNRSYRAHPA